MSLGITITKSEIVFDTTLQKWGWSVEATSNRPGADSNVFVYHAAAESDPVKGDTFATVASIQDMNEMPIGTSIVEEGSIIPFYRVSKAIFACNSTAEADYVWAIIQQKLNKLAQDTAALETMTPVISYEL